MKKYLLFGLLFLAGVAILVGVFHLVDLRQALAQIRAVGYLGSAVFVLNIGLTFLAPAAGWYLLMRADGIPVTARQTFISALMGHAFNLVTPMMYLGGEPIRTFYIAGVARVSKRQVLATIIVSKFQELSALALFMIVGTGIMVATSDLSGPQLAAAVLAGVILLSFLVAVLCLFVGDFKPTVKLLNRLIRWRVFPERLERIKHKAVEMETMVRHAFTRRWKVYLASQALTLLSALAQFLRPLLFYGFLRGTWTFSLLPSLSEMSILFVLSQLIFILPSTPGGLGVYDAGLVGFFKLLEWPEADGGAFAILIRAADLLYIAGGTWLAMHYGMTSLLKSAAAQAPHVPRVQGVVDEVGDAGEMAPAAPASSDSGPRPEAAGAPPSPAAAPDEPPPAGGGPAA